MTNSGPLLGAVFAIASGQLFQAIKFNSLKWQMISIRCVFCMSLLQGGGSTEHIFPESLGGTLTVAPVGGSCNKNSLTKSTPSAVLWRRSARYGHKTRKPSLMPEEIMRATLDTTLILGAVGNPLGPNASVIAHGLAGIYPMVLAQSVIAETLRHLRRGFGKVPPLWGRQFETLLATLFQIQHGWDP